MFHQLEEFRPTALVPDGLRTIFLHKIGVLFDGPHAKMVFLEQKSS